MTRILAASINILAWVDECIVKLEEIASSPSFKNWVPANCRERNVELLFCHKEIAICCIQNVANSCFLCE